jgi:hypothetical protein
MSSEMQVKFGAAIDLVHPRAMRAALAVVSSTNMFLPVRYASMSSFDEAARARLILA